MGPGTDDWVAPELLTGFVPAWAYSADRPLEVWGGRPFRRLRWELLTGEYGPNCVRCPLRGIGRVDDASAHRSHVADKRRS